MPPDVRHGRSQGDRHAGLQQRQVIVGERALVQRLLVLGNVLLEQTFRASDCLVLAPVSISDVNLDQHTIRLRDTKTGRAQTRRLHPSANDALGETITTISKLLGHGSIAVTARNLDHLANVALGIRIMCPAEKSISRLASASRTLSSVSRDQPERLPRLRCPAWPGNPWPARPRPRRCAGRSRWPG